MEDYLQEVLKQVKAW